MAADIRRLVDMHVENSGGFIYTYAKGEDIMGGIVESYARLRGYIVERCGRTVYVSAKERGLAAEVAG